MSISGNSILDFRSLYVHFFLTSTYSVRLGHIILKNATFDIRHMGLLWPMVPMHPALNSSVVSLNFATSTNKPNLRFQDTLIDTLFLFCQEADEASTKVRKLAHDEYFDNSEANSNAWQGLRLWRLHSFIREHNSLSFVTRITSYRNML
jgi:hypothetical protein